MEELIYRDRRGTNCSKWNHYGNQFQHENLMGLWVADMDFAAAQCVRDALQRHVSFGVFGYDVTPESYYDAFVRWEKTYHNYDVARAWIRYSPGVVAAFNWFIQMMTVPGDAVLIQSPVYYPFANAVRENHRTLVESELVNTNGVYTIDFADFEQKIREHHVKVFLMCSPHNPVGRVWTRQELKRLLDICRENGVFVISDEIHQDFTFAGHVHIPAATVGSYDDMLVTLTAPSKTFNLAGLKNSVIIIPDDTIRKKYDDYVAVLHVASGNSFGVVAAEAAYRGGRAWLGQVLETVYGNYQLLVSSLRDTLPQVVVSPLEGTYLAWLDFGAYLRPEQLPDYIEGRCGLAMDYGAWFGGASACHVRMNLATCRENIAQAAKALADHL
ncbi:MAG: pyridoxal phosphate-dependent aminotransferase [Oscillospiraceae bacterium]|nr:pyridoxal phosphate-dependent aminotransferase [Oscillospiraceae bacterium]